MAGTQNAFKLDGQKASGLLPASLVGEIFAKAKKESVVAPLCGTVPMGINGTEYVIRTGHPEADIVKEAEAKPISTIGVSTKTVKPVKAATIVYWSKEARIANPGGVLDQIAEDMANAIRRQVDYAILYGKSAKSNADIPGVEHVSKTTTSVELGTAAANKGGLTTDFVDGYNKVLAMDGDHDFTGFVADPLLRGALLGAVDVNGRPVYQTAGANLADPMGQFLGLPVTYGKVVSGRIAGHEDTKVRAFGGDFAGGIKLGFVENITVSMSNEATIKDGSEVISLWQNNLEAALVEAIFGWVIDDVNAFVAYKEKTPKA